MFTRSRSHSRTANALHISCCCFVRPAFVVIILLYWMYCEIRSPVINKQKVGRGVWDSLSCHRQPELLPSEFLARSLFVSLSLSGKLDSTTTIHGVVVRTYFCPSLFFIISVYQYWYRTVGKRWYIPRGNLFAYFFYYTRRFPRVTLNLLFDFCFASVHISFWERGENNNNNQTLILITLWL